MGRGVALDLAASNYPAGLVAHSTQIGHAPNTNMTREKKEDKKLVRRCAECVCFGTHKCTQRRQLYPIIPDDKKPVFDFSKPGTWQKWLDWFYSDPRYPVVTAYRWIAYPIFKTDVACDDFIPFG